MEAEPQVSISNDRTRTLRGRKKSTAKHNVEGLSEGELKRQRRQEAALCRKYKKRHRKDLSSEELEEIILATKQPFMLLKDIAQRY